MTGEFDLSASVREFLHARIASYEQLEVLLLLARRRDMAWEISVLAERLQLPEAAVQEAVEELSQRRLATETREQSGAFRYCAEGRETDQIVKELVETYEDHRLGVVRAMTIDSIDRLRASVGAVLDAVLVGNKRA